MKTLTETKTTIDFDIDNCESEAVIENRVIKSTRIHIKGDTLNYFTSNSEQFIRDVYKALQGLLHHIDKERGLDRSITDIEFQEIAAPFKSEFINANKL